MNCKGGWRGEGGLAHRLSISRKDIKFYGKRWRFVALVRVLWLTQIRRHYCESCQVCGRDYVLWVTTTTLYEAVKGNRGGQLCPRCFTVRASDVLGLSLAWEPFDAWDNERFDAIFSTGLRNSEGT
jgi:hypothetical protein